MKHLLLFSLFLITVIGAKAQDIQSGLVARYSFCGNLNDQSGNENHGNYMGAVNPTYVEDHNGNENKAMYFDGVSDWVRVPPTESINSPTTAVTVSAWVNYHSLAFGTWASVFAKTDQYELETRSYSLGINGETGQIYWHSTYVGQAPLQPNTWYHMAITYTPELLKCYLDGELIGEAVPNDVMTPNEYAFEIGRDTPQTTDYFHGFIDEVNVYNRVLSDADIALLYAYNECNAASVYDQQWSGKVQVFPNPVTDYLIINFEGQSNTRDMRILNTLGQTVLVRNTTNMHNKLDLSALESGAYILQISSEEGVYMQKIMR
jgi:hypothetical protein